jgi:hypothetical protein
MSFGRISHDYKRVEHWPQFWPTQDFDFEKKTIQENKIVMLNGFATFERLAGRSRCHCAIDARYSNQYVWVEALRRSSR